MKRGTVTVNDKNKIRVEFEDGSWAEHVKKEDSFFVGENVTCSEDTIFKDASNGHIYLIIDFKGNQ
jgi:hypothetical protein